MLPTMRSCAFRALQPLTAYRDARLPALMAALDAGGTRCLSSGPKTATPPPDAARGATADLADMFITDPVDVVVQREVQIMEPVFRWG